MENKLKVVLDKNVLISAILFGGKPQKVLNLVFRKQIFAVTSHFLLAELGDVLTKKFKYPQIRVLQIEKKIKDSFIIVQPKKSIKILKDDPDNRVLETAVQGKCKYIVTGDKELLNLGKYKKVRVVKVNQFLLEFSN